MQKLFLSFLVMVFSVAVMAQKTINDPNAEKRTVSSFHGIEVGTGIELSLTQSNTEDVAVSAASVNKIKESKNLKAYVSFKTLDVLNANTGADIDIVGSIKSPTLDIKANTGALIDGEVDVTILKVSQNTGSKINLSGRADKLTVDGDTGSKFKGEDMATSNCNVTVSTGAIVSVKAEKELQVKANTGGVVRYKGNASIKEIKTNTGGTVSKI